MAKPNLQSQPVPVLLSFAEDLNCVVDHKSRDTFLVDSKPHLSDHS